MVIRTADKPNRRRVAWRLVLALCVFVILTLVWRVPMEDKKVLRVTDKFGVRGVAMPQQEGSVRFVGTLYAKGTAAAKTKFVFLFDNDFVSKTISTNSEGKFEYTLPMGHWKLLAPHVPGLSGDIRFYIDPPVQRREL